MTFEILAIIVFLNVVATIASWPQSRYGEKPRDSLRRRRRPAEQRDQLAPVQPIELHRGYVRVGTTTNSGLPAGKEAPVLASLIKVPLL